LSIGFVFDGSHSGNRSAKKTDVAKHPKEFRHVGLLFNKLPGTARLLFI